MSSEKKILGNRLRQIRISKGLTQEQLGEKINVSANAIGQFERGVILPNYSTLSKLIDALDIDANLIFARESNSYSQEAVWIAKAIEHLSRSEKQSIGRLFSSITNILLEFERIDHENSDL